MIHRVSPAVWASFLLHVLLFSMIVTFLRPPKRNEREELPLVQILTLVRPPPSSPAPAKVPVPKPAAPKTKERPAPVTPVPAPVPVVEKPVPEPVQDVVSAEKTAPPPKKRTAPVPAPVDPVYPVSRLKGGIIPLVRTEVPYPLIAQDRGIEGSVVVIYVVEKSGHVGDIWIAKSSHYYFSKAVMKHVRKWRFKPPVIDGRAARVKVQQPIEFRLE
ncbi:MAG: energy transducer TonB [Chitinispirillaceae bacterium]|nr:energy transducer TonB [Chitinispirillaceae bacterium]